MNDDYSILRVYNIGAYNHDLIIPMSELMSQQLETMRRMLADSIIENDERELYIGVVQSYGKLKIYPDASLPSDNSSYYHDFQNY